MGFVTKRTSDLSGIELPDDQVTTVVIKSHPDITESKVFDASVKELAGLKGMSTNLVQLEVRTSDGTVTALVVTKSEFAKLVSAEQLKSFNAARGRRPGYRPPSNGSANGKTSRLSRRTP